MNVKVTSRSIHHLGSVIPCVDPKRTLALAALRHIVQKEVESSAADWVEHIPEGPRQVSPAPRNNSNLTVFH